MRTHATLAIFLLATIALAPAATASTLQEQATSCTPEYGPFDPCLWYCEPGYEELCTRYIPAAGGVWARTVCRYLC